jgi:hypothetical protein
MLRLSGPTVLNKPANDRLCRHCSSTQAPLLESALPGINAECGRWCTNLWQEQFVRIAAFGKPCCGLVLIGRYVPRMIAQDGTPDLKTVLFFTKPANWQSYRYWQQYE